MEKTRRERTARVLEQVADQFPRAFVSHPRGIGLVEAASDPDWWRGPDRFVLPRPDALDHWEATRLGDPWAFIDLTADGVALGLQVEGEGLDRVARVLLPEHATRADSLFAAAARLDDKAVSAAVHVRLREDGRWDEEVIDDRVVSTPSLGPALLDGLVQAAQAADAADDGARRPAAAGLRVVRSAVEEADAVGLRRAAKRLVDLWRPLWGLTAPRPRLKKPDLDRRLEAAYRRSLRLIAGRMGPAERATLRVEVRDLQAGYRDAGLQRPRLLDIVSDRLGLL